MQICNSMRLAGLFMLPFLLISMKTLAFSGVNIGDSGSPNIGANHHNDGTARNESLSGFLSVNPITRIHHTILNSITFFIIHR